MPFVVAVVEEVGYYGCEEKGVVDRDDSKVIGTSDVVVDEDVKVSADVDGGQVDLKLVVVAAVVVVAAADDDDDVDVDEAVGVGLDVRKIVVVAAVELLGALVPFVKLDTQQKMMKKVIVLYDDDDRVSLVLTRLALFLLVSRHKDLMGVEVAVVVLEHYMMLMVVAVIEGQAEEGYTMQSSDAQYEVTYAETHPEASSRNGTQNRPNIESG